VASNVHILLSCARVLACLVVGVDGHVMETRFAEHRGEFAESVPLQGERFKLGALFIRAG
jgi:hypothetical protein